MRTSSWVKFVIIHLLRSNPERAKELFAKAKKNAEEKYARRLYSACSRRIILNIINGWFILNQPFFIAITLPNRNTKKK